MGTKLSRLWLIAFSRSQVSSIERLRRSTCTPLNSSPPSTVLLVNGDDETNPFHFLEVLEDPPFSGSCPSSVYS